MHFSPAECSAAPIGLIATELELHALARARRKSAPEARAAHGASERFSPADGAQPAADAAAGVCASELDAAVATAPLPLRTAGARSARPSVAAEPAQAGPLVS